MSIFRNLFLAITLISGVSSQVLCGLDESTHPAAEATPTIKVVEVQPTKPKENSPKLESAVKPIAEPETKVAASSSTGQTGYNTGVGLSSTNDLSSPKSLFFQTNIGVGFLYFSGVRGNIMGEPVRFFRPDANWRDVPVRGRLMYNKTPLYEYILGYRASSFVKIGISYQYQGGVLVQTKPLPAFTPGIAGIPRASNFAQFSSQLDLNAFLLKFYFELPYAGISKKLAVSPYLAVGIGPGWQSWTWIETNYMRGNAFLVAGPVPLRKKTSANAVWMLDAGLKLQSFSKDPSFSFLVGCKYNEWGQARSIGKMSQQGPAKFAISKPIRIKTVYQFAPYLGFQWNFSNANISNSSYKLLGKSPNVWAPYFANVHSFQTFQNLWTEFNVGLGLLYFSGVKGNLMGEPVISFNPVQQFRDVPLKGRLIYNKTPLFEYLLGYNLNASFKAALSYQYQSGVIVQSKPLAAYASIFRDASVQFKSNLSLNAILFKLYFQSGYAMIMKSLATSLYLAAGVGPGWQSWTAIEPNYITGRDALGQTGFNASGGPLPLNQKISANAVWMLDAGFRIQGAYPDSSFSALVGCKYNQWGQARYMGKMSQQPSHKLALSGPVTIKTVYQFSPYLGVQWNFSNSYTPKSSYCLKGKNPNVWVPYFANRSDFQCPRGFLSQFNAGVGFLYFSGLRGNLMGAPARNFTNGNQHRNCPIKGRLIYNRTPLFEYLFGYQFNTCVKLALSYQHQGGINISTKALPSYSLAQQTTDIQFISALALDAILAKVYFELPFAMIWKNLSTSPYLALGVGPGWQSWTRIRVHYFLDDVNYVTHILSLQNKVSANAVWMVDAGFRIQTAYPQSAFSVLLGCKYNQWGQARSIGKMSQQKSHKLAIFKPVRIKTVYQFAPYLGVNWNF